ncbi:MAG: HAD family hydrolase, partial [Opitutaceae bacterium]|nr:HAD family hydrolase [Opitutaceae bacterium]
MPAIAFDADDTLWHNQPIYETAAARLREILAPYHPAGGLDRRLYETELANLPLYGYGIKSFTLSNIETAIRLSNGKITAAGIHAIL